MAPRPAHPPLLEPAPPSDLTGRDIEGYDHCPRRFFYERVAALRGEAPDSSYLAAHRCVLSVIDEARRSPVPLAAHRIRQLFEEAWAGSGLAGHVFEQPYRGLVETMLDGVSPVLAQGLNADLSLSLDIDGMAIKLPVDQVSGDPGLPIYRSIRSGRASSTEPDRLANTLILEAVRQRHGRGGSVETFHLVNAVTTPITQTDAKRRNRLATGAELVAAIGRGEYPPDPSDWSCPRCRYFFLCPAPVTGGP